MYPQIERAYVHVVRAVVVPVLAVGVLATEPVGLRVHDGVRDLLGKQHEWRPDVGHSVCRPRDGGLLRCRVGLLSPVTDLVISQNLCLYQFQIQGGTVKMIASKMLV